MPTANDSTDYSDIPDFDAPAASKPDPTQLGSLPLPNKAPLNDVTVHYDQVGALVAPLPEATAKEMLTIALMTLNGTAVLHQPGFVEKIAKMNRTIIGHALKEDIDAETAVSFDGLAAKFDELLANTLTRLNAPKWRDFPSVSVPLTVFESMLVTLMALTDETFIKRCVAANNGMLSAYAAVRSLLHAQMINLLPRDATPAQTEQMEAYITTFTQATVKYIAQTEARVPAPKEN